MTLNVEVETDNSEELKEGEIVIYEVLCLILSGFVLKNFLFLLVCLKNKIGNILWVSYIGSMCIKKKFFNFMII